MGVIGALVKVRNLRKLRMAMNYCLDFRVVGGKGRWWASDQFGFLVTYSNLSD